MAKSGRKRKFCQREPNGQPQRPSREEGTANQLRVITSQPHRKGTENPTDQKHESVFGRFCIRNRLREQIYTASVEYTTKVRRLWAVKGVPTDLRLGGSGNGQEPSAASVERWKEELDSINAGVIANCHDAGLGLSKIRDMILFEKEAPETTTAYAVQAAFWLAVGLKCLSAKDRPF